MNKKHIVIFVIIVILILACTFGGFYFHDEIDKFLNGQNWNYINSYAQIDNIQPTNCFGRNLLGVVTKEGFNIYNKNTAVTKEDQTISSVMYASRGAFTALYTVDSKTLYLIKNNDIVFNEEIDTMPKSIYINDDGYVVVLYTQAGYKTGIKVYNPNGDEVLATYLASSYATCVDISKDNRLLYVGEVDSSGIKIKSKVKTIDFSSKDTSELELPLGCIITEISSTNNKLIAKTDVGIFNIDMSSKSVEKYIDFKQESVISSYLYDNNVVIIKNNVDPADDEDLSEYLLVYHNEQYSHNLPIDSVPQGVDLYNNTIALNFGNEVWVVESGYIKSKIAIDEALIGMNIFSYGKELALVYRNKIEFVKI
ncbi:MAG: hypothetical protein IKR04_08110 [Clostridia bacterium]|nr:hypothetical protein [Clostridia bacterium]